MPGHLNQHISLFRMCRKFLILLRTVGQIKNRYQIMTTASGAIGINYLNIKHMGRLHNQVVFQYDKLHKGWRRAHWSPVVRLFCYSHNTELCVVKF